MLCINETRNLVVARRVRKALNFKDRLIGLLNRKSINEDEGLLITKCSQIHTIFMRFAIDAVFLDGGNEVLKVLTLKPFRISPFVRRAKSVLELRAHTASDKIKTGDLLGFSCVVNK